MLHSRLIALQAACLLVCSSLLWAENQTATTIRLEPTASATPTPITTKAQAPTPQPDSYFTINDVKWITNYDQARRNGTESKRPLILFVSMDACHYCDKMFNESLIENEACEKIRDSFVAAKIHIASDSKLGEQLKITLYPTTMFIAPDGKILSYLRGYVPRETFQKEMQQAEAECDERIARLAGLSDKRTANKTRE